MNGYVNAPRDRILQTHAIEKDIDGRDKDLPHAVDTENEPKNVEVATFKSTREFDSFVSTTEVVQLQKKMSAYFFQACYLKRRKDKSTQQQFDITIRITTITNNLKYHMGQF